MDGGQKSRGCHRLEYESRKLSGCCVVETAKENNLSPYHYLRYLFGTLPNIDLNNKEEIDKVLPWSMDLPSSCRVPKKVKQTKNNSKINFYCIFWSYLTFTLKRGRNFGHPFTI
nr:transposase domain-containing protein [Bacillus mycoides]